MPYITKRKISVRSDKHETRERHNDKWNHYYQNRQWKLLRQWKITNYPLCQDCLFEGRSVPADEVHHIVPFSTGSTEEEKMRLLLDPDNIVSLCSMHHDKRHGKLNNRK